MKNKLFIILTSILSLFCLSGCDQTSGMLGGGALGTLAGAGVGSALGGSDGAILGAVVGGLGGAAVGSNIGAQEERARNQPRCSTHHTTHVHTERVEVRRPVEKRVYVREYGCRPYREEVYRDYGPAYEYHEYRSSCY